MKMIICSLTVKVEPELGGAVAQYCPWYRVWNLNGKAVLGPNDGKNICPFESN